MQNAHPLICEARIFTSSSNEGSNLDDLTTNVSRAAIARYAAGDDFCIANLAFIRYVPQARGL